MKCYIYVLWSVLLPDVPLEMPMNYYSYEIETQTLRVRIECFNETHTFKTQTESHSPGAGLPLN